MFEKDYIENFNNIGKINISLGTLIVLALILSWQHQGLNITPHLLGGNAFLVAWWFAPLLLRNICMSVLVNTLSNSRSDSSALWRKAHLFTYACHMDRACSTCPPIKASTHCQIDSKVDKVRKKFSFPINFTNLKIYNEKVTKGDNNLRC